MSELPHEHIPCMRCGRDTHVFDLDAKPRWTPWLLLIFLVRGQMSVLSYAGDHGYDFDRFECRDCYGPGFNDI